MPGEVNSCMTSGWFLSIPPSISLSEDEEENPSLLGQALSNAIHAKYCRDTEESSRIVTLAANLVKPENKKVFEEACSEEEKNAQFNLAAILVKSTTFSLDEISRITSIPKTKLKDIQNDSDSVFEEKNLEIYKKVGSAFGYLKVEKQFILSLKELGFSFQGIYSLLCTAPNQINDVGWLCIANEEALLREARNQARSYWDRWKNSEALITLENYLTKSENKKVFVEACKARKKTAQLQLAETILSNARGRLKLSLGEISRITSLPETKLKEIQNNIWEMEAAEYEEMCAIAADMREQGLEI